MIFLLFSSMTFTCVGLFLRLILHHILGEVQIGQLLLVVHIFAVIGVGVMLIPVAFIGEVVRRFGRLSGGFIAAAKYAEHAAENQLRDLLLAQGFDLLFGQHLTHGDEAGCGTSGIHFGVILHMVLLHQIVSDSTFMTTQEPTLSGTTVGRLTRRVAMESLWLPPMRKGTSFLM